MDLAPLPLTIDPTLLAPHELTKERLCRLQQRPRGLGIGHVLTGLCYVGRQQIPNVRSAQQLFEHSA
eukprot:5640439-Prymnesium_polylepis.1